MRTVVGTAVVMGLLFGEALHQRHQHALTTFERALKDLSSSLGDFDVSRVAYHSALTRFAQAMSDVLAEARRRV